MTLRANVFPEITSPKNVIRLMSKKPRFKGRFDREHCKWVETILQSE